ISRVLKEEGTPLGATAVRAILREEGFAALPRRLDEERRAAVGPTKEAVAEVREFSLSPREFTTRVGGLFLFIPDLPGGQDQKKFLQACDPDRLGRFLSLVIRRAERPSAPLLLSQT